MEKTFTIQFSQAQLQVLNDALGEVAFKLSAPLVMHINQEIQRQLQQEDDLPAAV
jgi:hypothetical protein